MKKMDTITTPAAVQSPPSTSIQHSAQVSLTSRSPASVVHLVQYDTNVPVIAVNLTANGQPYTVPSGAAVNVRLAKPDGTYVYNPAYGLSEDSQTVYIAVTVQMTVCSGRLAPVIEVVIDGGVAATGFFILDIDPNPIPEDAIASTDEYKTIQQLAIEVTQAAQVVQDNLDGIQYVQQNSASITAVAQNGAAISAVAENVSDVNTVAQNLTPIQTASEHITAIQQAPTAADNAAASATLAESWAVGGTGTREGENTNNAQYWAGQAQTVAQGALGWYESESALQAAHPTGSNGQWAIVGTTDTIWTWDSDTAAWVDTGAQIDLSNYYTKPQAEARFQMPVGYIFDWAPVEGQDIDLSTPEKVAAHFGYGIWKELNGVFTFARDENHEAGSVGGEETHALTVEELAAHGHTGMEHQAGKFATSSGFASEYKNASRVNVQGAEAGTGGATWQWVSMRWTDTVENSGEGQPHNNMPPYLTVYKWQRIA